MDENLTDPNEENINAIENAVDSDTADAISSVSPRDSEPYSVPVNNISQPVITPVEAKNENIQNDFQIRQEAIANSGAKKSKNKKSKLLVFVLIFILLIGGGAAAYYYFFIQNTDSSNKTVQTTKETTKKVVKTVALLPADVIKVVQADLTKKFSNVVSPDTKLTGDQIAFRTSDTAPYWKIPGEKFYVNYTGDGASNLGVYYVGNLNKYNLAIIESLNNQGFVLAKNTEYGNESNPTVAYLKDDVICTVASPSSGVLGEMATLNCGQISKYTKSLDSYIATKPFVDAYLTGGGAVSEGSMFANIQIKSSIVIGYQKAELAMGNVFSGVGGAAGLFYKKGNDNWTFFKGTQQLIPCSEYNTVDLVNAFKNEQCYDAADAHAYVH